MNKLTTGTPYKQIIKFTTPIFLGQILQQLYNMVDSAIVGRFVGMDALAGVGSTGSLNFLVLGFLFGISSGFGVLIAKSFGAKDMHKLSKFFTHSIYLAVVLSIALSVIMVTFIEDILKLMNTNDEMMGHAKDYITVVFIGLIGMFLYNLFSSCLVSIGNSKTPLFFLIACSILNVVLDLIFVLVFNLGVFGTGLATVISQSVCAIACFVFIIKKVPEYKTVKEDWTLDLSVIKELLSSGVPMGLQFSITSIGSLMLQSVINELGTDYVAAVAAATKINYICMNVITSLGAAMATYCSQNLGANKIDRISVGIKHSLIIGCVYSVVIFIAVIPIGRSLVHIFISPEQTVAVGYAYSYLLINVGSFIISTVLHILRYAVQGLGYSKFAMLAGIMELGARCVVAFVLVPNFGYVGAMLSDPVAWFFAVVFLVPTYILIIRRIQKSHTLCEAK